MPRLFHNTTTGREQPNNLVMVVLEGIHRGVDGSNVRMPGLADALSDAQVATLTTYVRAMYGSPAQRISADGVTSIRSGNSPTRLVLVVRVVLTVAVATVALFIIWWWRSRRRPGGSLQKAH